MTNFSLPFRRSAILCDLFVSKILFRPISTTFKPVIKNKIVSCNFISFAQQPITRFVSIDKRFNLIRNFSCASFNCQNSLNKNLVKRRSTLPGLSCFDESNNSNFLAKLNSKYSWFIQRDYANEGSNFSGISSHISSLKSKKRSQRKKAKVVEPGEQNAEGFQIGGHHRFLTFDPDFSIPDIVKHKPSPRDFQIVAYGTADEYNLEMLSEAFIKQGLYVEAPINPTLPSNDISHSKEISSTKLSDVLHLTAAYLVTPEKRTMYLFREGVIVFWNMPALERENVLQFLHSYEESSYDQSIVLEEAETLIYTYTDSATRFKPSQNLILLNDDGETELEKFTFSNALAMSVKLGIWEASLDKYIENIEYVTEELSRTGHVKLTQVQVLQRMGQLLALRHLINLSSDLLDTPDFYWDHENLEQLYNKTASHLSIHKRTSVMNTKLSNCLELMELLKSHLHESHAARLEWIIIILIMIEVFFEILHFM